MVVPRMVNETAYIIHRCRRMSIHHNTNIFRMCGNDVLVVHDLAKLNIGLGGEAFYLFGKEMFLV